MRNPLPIICFGDSITHCDGYAEADQWPVHLAMALDVRHPGRFAVFNRGVGGNTTALGLDRIRTDVIPLCPGLVLIEFGINDAYVNPWASIPRLGLSGYRENLAEIIRQVGLAGGRPVLIINHPITRKKECHSQGNGRPAWENLMPYNDAARECAAANHVPLIDLPALLAVEEVPMESFWSDDEIHLSPLGNRIYARLIRESLTKQDLLIHA